MASADELNNEIMKQLLLDALCEEVEKEYNAQNIKKDNPPIEDKEPEEDEPKKKVRSKKGHKKKKNLLYVLKQDSKAKAILILILTLLVNTYAWIIYISTVSTGVTMHIKNWLFEFSESSDEIILDLENIYPGMDTFTKEITGSNLGEMAANMQVYVEYVRILDDVYELNGSYTISGGGTGQYTSADLINIMKNNYPFKINVYIDGVLYDGSEMVLSTGDSKVVKYEVLWPYESTNVSAQLPAYDAIDTQYGNDAYDYYETHKNDTDPTTRACVYVKMVMKATQNIGGG